MKYFVGMDPDTSKQSAVIIDEDKNVVAVFMVKAPKQLKRRDAAVWMASKGALDIVGDVDLWEQELKPRDTLQSLAVEGQQIYQHDTGCKSNDVLNIALVTGGILCASESLLGHVKKSSPLPKEWKGTVPKNIHQCRSMRKAGLAYEKKGGANKKEQYPVPTELDPSVYKGPDKVNPGDWKDVGDSLGLALWARDEFFRAIEKKKY